MEDVLDLYEQPYDPKHPVICFDERPCQLIDDAIIPIPIKPGSPKKEHYEYIRNGTCCIFLAFEPRAGKRIVCVRERRTRVDYADFMKTLALRYPEAETILLVQDNLTHIQLVHSMKPCLQTKLLNLQGGLNSILPRRKEVGSIWLRSNSRLFQSNAWIAE
jgi:hypothetical protein